MDEKITLKTINSVDENFLVQCASIRTIGSSDKDFNVRAVWEDTEEPAHTMKTFGLVNRYNLSEGFPIQTIRKVYW